ncbi:MAG: alpha/beta hydrolase [Verrucomicrobia bacterium]|jgi:acetyl esterase/lipase|nr:alpha/beta hydrolase [Verrucomicrobiota bacterium]MBT7534969.1 alpha/beta hydrolase [Verrucomicrobiota bacterium]
MKRPVKSKCSLIIVVLVLFSFAATTILRSAESREQGLEVIRLWKTTPPAPNMELTGEIDTTKPDSDLVADRRVIRLGNVSSPTLTVHRPDQDKSNGTSVVICPGGGHYILAWDLEGTEVAGWLNELGVTAFILKYRVPSRDREGRRWISAVQDAQRAVSAVRHQAEYLNIDPERIGILGFSAGGETAALTAYLNVRQYAQRDAVDQASHLPDFNILIYPAGLVNKNKTGLPDHIQIHEKSPSTFMAHAFDDRVPVEGCLFLMHALKNMGVASELHIYAQGGHGYGLRKTKSPVTTWDHRCADWMRSQGWLSDFN